MLLLNNNFLHFNNKPPTLYSILESIVNFDNKIPVKISDLAKNGRSKIFNFDYPLTNNIKKEEFETMILNHFLMRRIGFETVNAFRIHLCSKLLEIMPKYNKMFDMFLNWNIFVDGEITTREGTDNRNINNTTDSINTSESSNTVNNNSTTTNKDIVDSRSSDTPQDHIEDVKNGNYVTEYKFDTKDSNSTDTSESRGSANGSNITNTENNTEDKNEYQETIKKSPADKMALYKEFSENITSIYTLIYKDLECLFYQLV